MTTFADQFQDVILPDARRRLIWLTKGMPILSSLAVCQAQADAFAWDAATELVDRALTSWMVDAEAWIPTLANQQEVCGLLHSLYTHVLGVVMEAAAERAKAAPRRAPKVLKGKPRCPRPR